MPGRRGIGAVDPSLCRRCQTNDPVITTRNEPFCSACFSKYVSSKIIKRMETFRVRHSEAGQERMLLLPLSFGSSSTSLLYVLSRHLKGQVEKTGRTGFRLHVLHVQDDTSTASDKNADLFRNIVSRFPEHVYSMSMLSDIFSSSKASPLPVCATNTSADGVSDLGRLQLLLQSTESATSRTDMIQILMRQLTVAFAKRNNCEAIIWGNSTTGLAERILAETAKGRGFSLPWIVADGDSPHGVPFYYPMRDLLSKEIAVFSTLVDPPLDDLILEDTAKPVVSMKNTTIDELMKQYFESVEREYPSIVANVVKTTSKLETTALSLVENQCELCDMPLDGHAPEKSRLCYGCIRTLPQPAG